MKKTLVRIAVAVLALLLVVLSVGCSSGKTLMTLDGQTLSVNLYELMLSIQKGNMAYMINYWYGDVDSPDFWSTVIDENSTTYDNYYTMAVYKKARNLLAASVLFDNMKLKLSDATLKTIDEDIEKLIEDDAGSKKELNAILAQYGVNIDMYREYKILEAKSTQLAAELYGTGGSKIGAMLKEEYLSENYVAFRQILIANYYYVFETDDNGDVIYYTGNGSIAYDTTNGTPKLEDGKLVYYTEDGRIAYDKEIGKPSPVLDGNGEQTTAEYSEKEMLERAELAVNLRDMAGDSESVFLALRERYSDEGMADGEQDDTLSYLATNVDYASISSSMSFMDDIADALSELSVGETTIVQSDFGYHIVRRYATEKGAYADKDLAQWFSDTNYGVYDFMTNLENQLLLAVLEPYAERVESDDELLGSLNLQSVTPNYYYK